MAAEMRHTHVAHEVHMKLRLVHLALRRSLLGIVNAAAQVLPTDREDFIIYCKTFRDCLMDHHHHEDSFLFPFVEQHCQLDGTDLKQLAEQDQEILLALAAFSLAVQLSCKRYDGKNVAQAAMVLQAYLLPHMAAEEAILTEEVLARGSEAELRELLVKVDSHVMSTNPFKQMPFLVHNLTKREAHYLVFHRKPWFFRKVSFPVFWSGVYRRAWRKFGSRPRDGPAPACC